MDNNSNWKIVGRRNGPSKTLIITAVMIATTAFVLDLLAPLGVAGGVPYVIFVLCGWWFRKRNVFVLLAVTSSILTVLGYLFSPEGGIGWVVFTNRAYALIAIWSTAIVLFWAQADAFQQHHERYEKADSQKHFSTLTPYRLTVVAILLVVIGLSSLGVLSRIEFAAKKDVGKSIRTVLETTHISIRTLFKHQKNTAKLWANNALLRAATQELAGLPRSPEILINSRAQADLREWLKPIYKSYGYRGFFVIGEDNINLASSRDSNTGLTNLLTKQEGLLDRLWAGETLISFPQRSDVALKDVHGEIVEGLPTMFVASPIKNSEDQVIAILAFRLEPDKIFKPTFEQGQYGDTGVTYVFDHGGQLISESRFNDQLMQIGVIPDNKYPGLRIEIRDPGADMTLGKHPSLPREGQPLTLMARSATAGESGSNLDGYRDYRGTPVVGVWLWDDELGFGLATEVDLEEAFSSLNNMRFVIIMFAFLASGLMLIITAVFSYTQKAIAQRDARNRLILSSVGEGIFGLNSDGRVAFVNPAACKMLGYAEQKFLGQHLHTLVQHSYQDGSVYPSEKCQMTRTLADSKVYHVDNEVLWHKDGFSIPIEYTSTPIINNGELTGSVIAFKDIIERRRSESELRKLSSVVEQSPVSIVITDKQGIIEYINPTFTKVSGYSAEEAIGNKPRQLGYGLESRAFYKDLWSTVSSGQKWSGEIRNRNKRGEIFLEQVTISPIQSVEGNITHFVGLKEDISERLKAEQRLRESEAMLSAAIENFPGGFLLIDSHGRFEIYNQKFIALYPELQDRIALGMSVDEFLRMGVERGLYPEAEDRPEEWVSESKINYKKKEIEFEQKLKGNRWIHIAINQLPDGKCVCIHFDVTELRNAQKEAETANRAKSEFLSSMSHELRTPLNAIMGYAQLFSYDDNLTLQQQDNAEEIHSAGSHLLQLINDVLDLSKIEAGYVEMSFEPLSLEDMLAECRWITDPLARKQGISLEFKCQGCFVQGDQTRLKQVLLNVLSNALKYNRPGGSVCVVCQPCVEGQVQISVTDTGLGMTKAQLDNLFQPFNRLGAEAGDIEGSGIGLVITQRLIEMMSGAISVESTLGEGTTFYVSLPEAEAPSTAKHYQVVSASVDSVTVRLGHVLLVEDNPANQALFEQQLTLLGHRVSVAANGEEGLRAWQAGDFDVVLSDINMPVMDGYAFVRSLRETELERNLDRIPVIAITANALKGERECCLSAGMDDYISKPVDLNSLKQVLNRWTLPFSTKANDAMEEAVATAPHQGLQLENDTPIEVAELIWRVGGNPDIHRRLLQVFVETTPGVIQQIHQAFSQNQAGVIGELGHKLKSSAGGMGANELSEVCYGLERAGKSENWTEIDHLVPRLDPLMDAVINYVDSME